MFDIYIYYIYMYTYMNIERDHFLVCTFASVHMNAREYRCVCFYIEIDRERERESDPRPRLHSVCFPFTVLYAHVV